MGHAKPMVFVPTGTAFIPAEDRGWYRRYDLTLKRCVSPADGINIDSFVEEREDGRYIGFQWAFIRMGGHLCGGLYHRYHAVVEHIPCPMCHAPVGEPCRGNRGRWWGTVHSYRTLLPPRGRSERYADDWRGWWKAVFPELKMHLIGLEDAEEEGG